MKALSDLLNIFAWIIVLVVFSGWLYLYWEDHQDVMSYIKKKPDTQAVIAKDSVLVALVGEKKLSCDRVPYSEYGYAVIDGYSKEVAFRWVHDESPLSSFQKGKLDIGVAEFAGEGLEGAELVGFSIEHICHGVPKRSPVYWVDTE